MTTTTEPFADATAQTWPMHATAWSPIRLPDGLALLVAGADELLVVVVTPLAGTAC
jgi:hypothetical protein